VAVLRLTQTIQRPVGEVFGTLIDAGQFASWNPTIKASRREFERDRRLRLVPLMKSLSGGHRFVLTDLGNETRVDHELEMIPRGMFKLFSPLMGVIGRKNLKDTANALKVYLEATERPTDLSRCS